MNNTQEINSILNRMGQELDLPKGKAESIEESYHAISRYLNNNHEDSENTDFVVYTTGSYATKTVVKPLKKAEFDIDMIIEFKKNKFIDTEDANTFYKKLLDVFKEDSRYSEMVRENSHCITLEYLNGYHIDIIPAKQMDENSIKIPNKDRNSWVERRPKLYSKWFCDKSETKTQFLYYDSRKSLSESLFARDNAISIEELESSDFKEVNILNQAVQLIKRARDVYFDKHNIRNRIPQSIIFTTLCGLNYNGEIDLIKLLNKFSNIFYLMSKGKIDVWNPVNPSENFTEKWVTKKEYKFNFTSFALYFNACISKIITEINPNEIIKAIGELFGETLYSKVKTDMINEGIANSFFRTRDKNEFDFSNKEIDFGKRKGRGSSL